MYKRQFFFKGEYDNGTWTPLICFTWEKLAHKLENGLIKGPLTGTEEDVAGLVRRMHDRDNRRYYEAKDRAEKLEKHKGEFFMDTPSAGLGDSPELLDLLEYLKDTAYYWPACQFGKPNGKTEPPCVTSPNRWHCSRPGDWTHFPIWRKHAWRQPKD